MNLSFSIYGDGSKYTQISVGFVYAAVFQIGFLTYYSEQIRLFSIPRCQIAWHFIEWKNEWQKKRLNKKQHAMICIFAECTLCDSIKKKWARMNELKWTRNASIQKSNTAWYQCTHWYDLWWTMRRKYFVWMNQHKKKYMVKQPCDIIQAIQITNIWY